MKLDQRLTFLTIILTVFSGCQFLKNTADNMWDFPKTFWGSSTRALEKARSNALTKTYDKGYWDCFRTALKIVKKKQLVVFKKDEVRGLMVIMGIPGAVNTTEVGVFFVELNDNQTRVEISSLSTIAKRLLAKTLFHEMDVAFGLVAPDKATGSITDLKKQLGDADPNGDLYYNKLQAKGLLESICSSEGVLIKDPVNIKDSLQRVLPGDFDKIYPLLQKAWANRGETKTP